MLLARRVSLTLVVTPWVSNSCVRAATSYRLGEAPFPPAGEIVPAVPGSGGTAGSAPGVRVGMADGPLPVFCERIFRCRASGSSSGEGLLPSAARRSAAPKRLRAEGGRTVAGSEETEVGGRPGIAPAAAAAAAAEAAALPGR